MLRKRRLVVILLGVTLAVLGNATVALRAGEDSLQKLLAEVNSTTGKDVVDAQYKAVLKHPDAKKLVEYAHGLVKKNSKALSYNGALILAEVAQNKKEFAASEAFFRVCTKEAAELESTAKLFEAYAGLIELHYDNKKFKESEKVCREVLELVTGPGKPRVVFELFSFGPGQLTFVPKEKFDSAVPLHSPVKRLMIQSIAKQGKFDEALQMAQAATAGKDHWLAKEIVAWVMKEAGRSADAAKAYEDILNGVLNEKNMEPEDKTKYEDRFRYILSNLYVETKQVQKATEQLRVLVNRHPDEPGYLNDLAYIWADHDMNLDEAEKMILKAIDLDRKNRKKDPEADDRDNGAYLDSLGWVLHKQKKHKEAKEWLLKAIADDRTQHIEIYDHLGDVLIALGEKEAAVKYWQKGVDVAGESRRDQERKTRVLEKIKQHSK